MFPHLQADYHVGIEKYLIISLLNRDCLGLDHMEITRHSWWLPGENSLCLQVGVGKSGPEDRGEIPVQSKRVHWAGWC